MITFNNPYFDDSPDPEQTGIEVFIGQPFDDTSEVTKDNVPKLAKPKILIGLLISKDDKLGFIRREFKINELEAEEEHFIDYILHWIPENLVSEVKKIADGTSLRWSTICTELNSRRPLVAYHDENEKSKFRILTFNILYDVKVWWVR